MTSTIDSSSLITSMPSPLSNNNNKKNQQNGTRPQITTKIGSVYHCPQTIISDEKKLQHHSDDYQYRTSQWHNGSTEKENSNIDNNEESNRLDYLADGKYLRLQAESLLNADNLEFVPQSWKCGLFKRCLLGIGILAGTGILGSVYRYYSIKHQDHSVQPEMNPRMGIKYQEHKNDIDNILKQQALYSANTINKAHSHQHISKIRHTPGNAALSHPRNKQRNTGKNNGLDAVTKKANRRVKKMLRGVILPKKGNINQIKLLHAVSVYLFHGNYRITDYENKTQSLARVILVAKQSSGSRSNTLFSFSQAKSIIRNWVFMNVWGMSPTKFIEKKMKQGINSSIRTIADIHQLFFANKLPISSNLHFERLDEVEYLRWFTMWQSFLNDEIPFLRFTEESVKNISLSHYDFANLYTGSHFLNIASNASFTVKEAMSTGEIIWDAATIEDDNENKTTYYLAPALFFNHDVFSPGKTQGKVSDLDIIDIYIQHRKIISDLQKDIKNKHDEYIAATKNWCRKSTLEKNYVLPIVILDIFGLINRENVIITQQNTRSHSGRNINNRYYHHQGKPKAYIVENPDDKYKRLTTDVANRFREVDKYLILAAIRKLPESEQKFISSPKAIIHFADIKMQTNRILWSSYGVGCCKDNVISLNRQTDLISVRLENRERFYALKANMDNENAYNIIRVDRNISKYIESGILDDNFHHEYKINTDSVQYNGDIYRYYIYLDRKKTPDTNNNISSMIDLTSNNHHDRLYHALYESGIEKSDIENFWDMVKHMIPFYDCVEGIINTDPVQAIPACLMDAMSFIPVFGTVANLNIKFGLGLAKGLRRGAMVMGHEGIKSASKQLLLETSLPTVAELANLGKNLIRGIDPGFELVTDIGHSFARKIVNLMLQNKQTKIIAQQVISANRFNTLPMVHQNTHVIDNIPQQKIPESTIAKHQERERDIPVNDENKYLDETPDRCIDSITPQIFNNNMNVNKNIRNANNEKSKNYNNIIDVYNRNKRGANKSKPCPDDLSSTNKRELSDIANTNNIIGTGSISTVYDLNNGFVRKVYSGYFDEIKKSRLRSANNNVIGFNRYYGEGAATLMIHRNENGKRSVSVKLKKIEGYALSDIPNLNNPNINTEILSAIKNTHPATYLANKLQKSGIVHNDINKGNIIYNNGRFFIVDFDSAHFTPKNNKVNNALTKNMENKLNIVLNDFSRDLKLIF